MGFTINESMVRVDIFKASGKWYTTLELNMNKGWDKNTFLHHQFKEAFAEQHPSWKMAETKESGNGWFAVCLEPYHECSYPIVIWLADSHERY